MLFNLGINKSGGTKMTIFRIYLVLAWIAVLIATVQAVGSQGLSTAGDIFLADLTSGTWHAQFGADFAGHLLIMAAWQLARDQRTNPPLRKRSLSRLMRRVGY